LADIVRASGAGDKPTTCPFGSSEPSRASIRGLALRMANRLVFSRGSRLSSCWRGYCSTCAASRPRWCDSRVPGVITEAGINRTQSASPCAVIAKSAGLQSRSCSSRSKATARSYAIAMFLPRSSEARDRRQERQRVVLGAYLSKSVTAATRSVTWPPEGQTGRIRPARRLPQPCPRAGVPLSVVGR
jgi:hypothetical protein